MSSGQESGCRSQEGRWAATSSQSHNTTFYSLEMQLVDLACFGSGKVHFYVLLALANAECASEWRPARNLNM